MFTELTRVLNRSESDILTFQKLSKEFASLLEKINLSKMSIVNLLKKLMKIIFLTIQLLKKKFSFK